MSQYTTLKKLYSISCKEYITLGLENKGNFIILVGSSIIGIYKEIKNANDTFEYYVNKI